MGNLHLTLACGPYDRLESLRDGSVRPEGIDLTCLPIRSSPEIFARMIKTNSFDVAEMSLAHYLTMRARNQFPFVALPVFPSRVFRHGFIFINRNAGIDQPSDLAGKRIGVQEYRQTAAVWIRGILEDEYGVDLSAVRWFEGGVNEPRRPDPVMDLRPDGKLDITLIPGDATLDAMLAAGEIDAMIGARLAGSLGRDDNVARLFPDYRRVEADYFRRTGIYPIMHTLVMRENLHREHPWVAESLFKAFVASKRRALDNLRYSGAQRVMLPWLFDEIDEIDALFGGDPFPYGIGDNRAALTKMIGYLHRQGFISDVIEPESVFAPIVAWQE